MNPESQLSTEDLARPGGVRQNESPADAPRGQGAGHPATSQTGPGGEPGYATAQGELPPEGAPGESQGYGDEQAGMGAAHEAPAGAQEPGRPDMADDHLGGGAGDQGPMTDTGDQNAAAESTDSGRPRSALGGGSLPDPDGGQRPGRDTSTGRTTGDAGEVALLGSADEDRFRQRWGDIQARFVDDPQEAVRTADGLVAELMQSLAQGFSEHKGALEAQWQSGGDPDTEELRQALQRYRSFFDRLLST